VTTLPGGVDDLVGPIGRQIGPDPRHLAVLDTYVEAADLTAARVDQLAADDQLVESHACSALAAHHPNPIASTTAARQPAPPARRTMTGEAAASCRDRARMASGRRQVIAAAAGSAPR
jgi:hypothetical protein